MKKLLSMLLAVTMFATLAVGCGKNDDPKETEGTTKVTESGTVSEDAKEIVFFLVSGKLGDKGLNDTIDEGIKKYVAETNANYSTYELAELQDFVPSISTYCEKGVDLIVLNSASASEFTPEVAEMYPDVKFVIFEGTVDGIDNVQSLNTAAADAGFVCGAFAALMNKELTGNATAGFIGGIRNPDLDRSQYGFMAGADYVGGEVTAVYVGNWSDAAKGKELATQLFSQGINIVQAFAGGANTGVFEAAKNMGDDYFAMGGATGQFDMSEKIFASMVKNTDVMAYDVCKEVFEGNFESGIKVVGLKENAVGIKYAPDGRDAVIPQSIKDKVEEIRQKVIDGEIVTPNTEDEYNEYLKNNK